MHLIRAVLCYRLALGCFQTGLRSRCHSSACGCQELGKASSEHGYTLNDKGRRVALIAVKVFSERVWLLSNQGRGTI